MPTSFAVAAFLLLSLFTRQTADRWIVASVAVLFGAVIPFFYLLHLLRKEKVTAIDVPLRDQRTVPYLVSALIYLGGFAALVMVGSSVAVYALMFCYVSNTLVISLINTKWKISAHAMGASGPLTALIVTFGWQLAPVLLLTVVIAWARVELKAHTRAQVAVGTLLGIFLTGAQVEMFYNFAGTH